MVHVFDQSDGERLSGDRQQERHRRRHSRQIRGPLGQVFLHVSRLEHETEDDQRCDRYLRHGRDEQKRTAHSIHAEFCQKNVTLFGK